MLKPQNPIVVVEVTDAPELAKARAQRERFDRNADWFERRSSQIYAQFRGQYICISGEEIFAGESNAEALRGPGRHTPTTTADLRFSFRPREASAFMRIDGEWLSVDGDVHLPIIRGEVLAVDDTWVPAYFLVDTGADRSDLSGNVLENLRRDSGPSGELIAGVGGRVESVVLQTELRLTRSDKQPVVFRGTFTALVDPTVLDMSILGRDILDLFAAIVDRPGNVVCLLGQRHGYVIQPAP